MSLPERKDVLDGIDAVDEEIDRLEGLAAAAGTGVMPDLRRGFLAPRKGLERLRQRLHKLLESLPDPVADDESEDEPFFTAEQLADLAEALTVTVTPEAEAVLAEEHGPVTEVIEVPATPKRGPGRPRKTTTEEK